MESNGLYPLLAEAVAAYDTEAGQQRIQAFRSAHPELGPKELLRRYTEQRLRHTGVVYGVPVLSRPELLTSGLTEGQARQMVFAATRTIEAELVSDVALMLDHHPTPRVKVIELMVCYAAFCERHSLSRRLHRARAGAEKEAVPLSSPPPALLGMSRSLSRALEKRTYRIGNPLLGLPLQNSFAYVDAKTLVRLAVVYFERAAPDRSAFRRVLEYRERERELLVQALLSLAASERAIGAESTRVMFAQLRSARLPWRTRRALMRLAHHPLEPLSLAARVTDQRTRDFLLEQVILAAMLDGHVSTEESGFIDDLAEWLGVTPEALAACEIQVVEFYEKHRVALDLFTMETAVDSYRTRILKRLQNAIRENAGLIAEEIKNTGQLAELLMKASTGERLSPQEWAQMRSDLLGILRSIPSLALFSLPGGMVLLPLLFKVLPDSLKPKAFAEAARRRAREENPNDPKGSADG